MCIRDRYVHDADGIELQLRPAYQAQRLGRVLRYEALTVWLHELLCRCVSAPLVPQAVRLMSPAPDAPEALEQLLGQRIDWQQESCSIRYPRGVLDMPLPGHSPALLAALSPMMDEWQLTVAAEPATSLTGQVQDWLARQADLCQVTLEQAAQALARGASTLRRHLQQEGHRFQDLMLAQRRARLFHAVAYGELPLGQLAAEQGYSDRASLERAFVNGFGWRPAQLRRTLDGLAPRGALRSQEALDWDADPPPDDEPATAAARQRVSHALDCRLQLAQAMRHERAEDPMPGDADLVAALARGVRWWLARQDPQALGRVPDPGEWVLAAHLLEAARLGSPAVLLRLSRLRLALAQQGPDPWAESLQGADRLMRRLEGGEAPRAPAAAHTTDIRPAARPAARPAGQPVAPDRWEAVARRLWAGPTRAPTPSTQGLTERA